MKQKFIVILSIALLSFGGVSKKNFTKYVNPFIGTDATGHTYPGAALPFGMVQLSPDTRLTGWEGCSGYHYSDSVIFGFSHTHLSGTGVGDYGDILLMPTVGKIQLSNGEKNHFDGYSSAFDKKSEKASAGFYAVNLKDYNIDVELTATERAGFHKYNFKKAKEANVIIDLTHRDKVLKSGIKFVGKNEIEGFRISEAWAREQHVYFVARFSKPFASKGIAENDNLKTDLIESNSDKIKAFVTFNTSDNSTVLVKVGISAVSIEGARANLDKEITDWNFEKIKNNADKAWNKALSKIEVEDKNENKKTVFYTALYHSLLNPNIFTDIDGKYRGTDLKIHEAKDFTNYTIFSLWDTFRAAHPLFTIIEREKTLDFIKTFLNQYKNGGILPVWELAGNETYCMIGYHSVPVIVDAYVKGIKNFDLKLALEAMKHSAELDHLGKQEYRNFGYIPSNKEHESVSKTLEYSYDDWCISEFAKLTGKNEDYKKYIERGQYYKNIFNPETGFMQAKANGVWHKKFDPAEVDFNFTEANSWQYSFFAPQDVSGMMKLFGGKEKFVEKLDNLFNAPAQTTGRVQVDITGLVGQYAHGNEPSHHMAYLYNYANQPWKTQKLVRKIVDELYTFKPDGLCGNEDCGQMSAWYVFSAMGFYPVTPGSKDYVVGSPIFDKVVINLENDKKFTISTKGNSKENIYVKSANFNKAAYSKSFINHDMIMNGGELAFEMSSEPNKSWGSSDSEIPVSEIKEDKIAEVPYLEATDWTFKDEFLVKIKSAGNNKIFYSTNGKLPDENSKIYTEPFKITESTTLNYFAVNSSGAKSKIVESYLHKFPQGVKITLAHTYHRQYTAGGDLALIDGIIGGRNFRLGDWQGYYGVNLDAVIDLGENKKVSEVAINFIQDVNSWIFMPDEVEFFVSQDGANFTSIGVVKTKTPADLWDVTIENYASKNNSGNARFIKVVGKTSGWCPAWHKGAGNKSFVFADEIVIK